MDWHVAQPGEVHTLCARGQNWVVFTPVSDEVIDRLEKLRHQPWGRLICIAAVAAKWTTGMDSASADCGIEHRAVWAALERLELYGLRDAALLALAAEHSDDDPAVAAAARYVIGAPAGAGSGWRLLKGAGVNPGGGIHIAQARSPDLRISSGRPIYSSAAPP